MSVLFSVPYALCSTRIFTVFCGTSSCLCSSLKFVTRGPQALVCESCLLLFCGTGSCSKIFTPPLSISTLGPLPNCSKLPNIAEIVCSLQIACPTALQFGFFGNYQFWQLLMLPPSLPVQTPVPPGSRGQRSSPSLSTSLDLHSLHPPCR